MPLAQVSGQVVAFEPDPTMRMKLVANLLLNSAIADKVTVHEQAVADSTGESMLNIRRVVDGDGLLNTGISSLISSTYLKSVVKISTLALDDMLDDLSQANIGFIKIDVEGAEDLVFRGALQTLRKYKPLLHWEAAYSIDQMAASSNSADSLSLLEEFGYGHFAVLRDTSTRPIRTVDELQDVGYDVNVISSTSDTQVPSKLARLGLESL